MNYYTWCSNIYRKDLKDDDTYIAYADSIVGALEKNKEGKNMPHRYIQAYNMKADALFSKGLYNESYDYYYKAKKLAKDNQDLCSLSQFSYSLGMVLYRQQRFREAANDFIDSWNESAKCKDVFGSFYRRQELLDNIGLCYYHDNKYDSAMLFYNKAITYIDSNYLRYDKRENAYVSAKAVVYGNMADLYIILKKYDTAKILLQKSINVNLQKGFANSDAVLDQVKLADLYFITGNFADLKNLLQCVKAELDTIPDKQVELSLNKLMWQYYDHEGDLPTAYKYLKAYSLMNDSFVAGNRTLIISDVAGRIRSLERQYQITLLNKNNFQAEIYLSVALLLALMAVIIIILVLKNVKRSRENVKYLTLLNERISEQREKLQKALTALEWKDKDRSRILRSAAHDILNPIKAIKALTDILVIESENFDSGQKEILDLIKESCDNSISLSQDILEAAASTDKYDLQKEKMNINKLIESCIDLLSIRAAEKKQQLVFRSSQDIIEAYVNKEKIWRVINNLIGNAIKFSYKNSVIEINLGLVAGNVDISVEDNGIGIPEKNKPHIFDVFSEAKMTGTSGEAPHGLGLSISLQIAKAHSGDIWFESEEGKGSTFHLVFPADPE